MKYSTGILRRHSRDRIGKSFANHLQNLQLVFERFHQYDLKLKPAKFRVFRTKS